MRVIYLNGRLGRHQGEVVLQIGSEKRADTAAPADAPEDQTRRD